MRLSAGGRNPNIVNNAPVVAVDCSSTSLGVSKLWTISRGNNLVQLGDTGYCLDAGSSESGLNARCFGTRHNPSICSNQIHPTMSKPRFTNATLVCPSNNGTTPVRARLLLLSPYVVIRDANQSLLSLQTTTASPSPEALNVSTTDPMESFVPRLPEFALSRKILIALITLQVQTYTCSTGNTNQVRPRLSTHHLRPFYKSESLQSLRPSRFG